MEEAPCSWQENIPQVRWSREWHRKILAPSVEFLQREAVAGCWQGQTDLCIMRSSAKSHSHKKYPNAQQRERKFLILALSLGMVLALIIGGIIYLMSSGRPVQ